MRAQHAIAAVAIILIGFGVKLAFFEAPIAEANSESTKAVNVDGFQIQRDAKNLHAQTFHDMALIFPIAPGAN
jgi:hypothetical protein